MKRALWVKQVGACLVVVASLAGVAWADPTGTADVLQILNGVALKGVAGDEQRVFRTIDLITFEPNFNSPSRVKTKSWTKDGGSPPQPGRAS